MLSSTARDTAQSGPIGAEFYRVELDKVQRTLSSRHVQMYIATVIGTGLFLGLGEVLAVAGPLGTLLVFIHIGLVGFCALASITEMAALAPVSGSMSHYAARWVDPALGFAVCAITFPAEVTAAGLLVGYWDENRDHIAIYITLFIGVAFLVNFSGARYVGVNEVPSPACTYRHIRTFGDSIIGGLVVNLGGGPDHTRSVALSYWRNPGPFVESPEPGARGRFIGLLLAVVPAAFSMNGMEIITLAAAETRNPRRNLRVAMKTVFFRIFVCYILTSLVIGMLVPSNDPSLLTSSNTAAKSPFVIAFQRAGIQVLPHIINAVVLTSAMSSGNGMLFSASRLLFALGVQGHAPRVVTRLNNRGVPYVAVLVSGLFGFLAYLNVANTASRVFSWLASLSAVGGLLNWWAIGLTYLRFYYGMRKQGINPSDYAALYRSRLQPYGAMWVVFWTTFLILVSGIAVFWHFNGSDFVAAYINLPLYALLFVVWKVLKRTKVVRTSSFRLHDIMNFLTSNSRTEGSLGST
ncbi:general amino acid permease 1 [Vararia minispora EC-137]|uniref:General amino acid permease 1 n=1 Tax=Vararia minispora EC-137 TaxID=1314806 RepID=A0ACB8QXQ1_9AGAM|nr:general amino acid permease 1 [Vararia minispora EC-137]